MSKNFEKVKYYYDHNLWNKDRVHEAVGKWITEAEFFDITGEVYID